MNYAHLHLLVNHLPVIGSILGLGLLAYALNRKSPELIRVGMGFFVLLALAGAAVYLTGEPAEEVVEGVAGVSESAMESHEEAALLATILLGLTGVLALGGLVAFRNRAAGVPRGFALATLVAGAIATAGMGYTAYEGGQIRHTEIRAGSTFSGAEQTTGGGGKAVRPEEDEGEGRGRW